MPNHNEHFHLHKNLFGNLSKLYFLQAALSFVKFLIGIFVPVYLYSKGFSLILISLYVIGVSMSYLVLAPLTIKFINKFGYNVSIGLSLFIYIFHLYSLQLVDSMYFFNLSWFSFGLHTAFFWPAFHSEMILFGNSKKRSSQIGTLQVIITLVTSMAPLIGGFLLEFADYYSLMVFSFFILAIGMLPFFLSQKVPIKKSNFTYSTYFSFLKSKKNSSSKKAYFFEGIESYLAMTFWPIILYLLFKNSFFKLGFLFTALSLVSVVFLVYFKSKFDVKDRIQVLKKVTSFLSASWFLRFFALLFASFFIYLGEILFKLTNAIFLLSFSSIFYNNATKNGELNYIMLRELYVQSGKSLFALFAIFLMIFLGGTKELFYVLILFAILVPYGLAMLREE